MGPSIPEPGAVLHIVDAGATEWISPDINKYDRG